MARVASHVRYENILHLSSSLTPRHFQMSEMAHTSPYITTRAALLQATNTRNMAPRATKLGVAFGMDVGHGSLKLLL
jgi:hypothetical protein